MEKKSKMITVPCDCRCCMFVVEKTIWEDGDVTMIHIHIEYGFNDFTFVLIYCEVTKRDSFLVHAALVLKLVAKRNCAASEVAILCDLRVGCFDAGRCFFTLALG